MSNGPLPSTRCLLSKLPAREVGDKVRFLGCVASYSTKSATLTLEHSFPALSTVSALVDVKLLLQSLKVNQTDVGRWVHVIGYITSVQRASAKTRPPSAVTSIGVQALVLWPAEDLDIPAYEKAFEGEADSE